MVLMLQDFMFLNERKQIALFARLTPLLPRAKPESYRLRRVLMGSGS